ncbi:hypothetical protein PQX77_019394 [Marasmius sp. AFHP31]|nr:hypothetical protein PQX77_019394 [Marasmius sp. AFHP31]
MNRLRYLQVKGPPRTVEQGFEWAKSEQSRIFLDFLVRLEVVGAITNAQLNLVSQTTSTALQSHHLRHLGIVAWEDVFYPNNVAAFVPSSSSSSASTPSNPLTRSLLSGLVTNLRYATFHVVSFDTAYFLFLSISLTWWLILFERDIDNLVNQIGSAKVLLGFDEPKRGNQAAVSPGDAANLWKKQIMKIPSSVRLSGLRSPLPPKVNSGSGTSSQLATVDARAARQTYTAEVYAMVNYRLCRFLPVPAHTNLSFRPILFDSPGVFLNVCSTLSLSESPVSLPPVFSFTSDNGRTKACECLPGNPQQPAPETAFEDRRARMGYGLLSFSHWNQTHAIPSA